MPATAGRVRMPANNRVHSSAALQTHGIWQSVIGYDPYAPENDKHQAPSSSVSANAAAGVPPSSDPAAASVNAYNCLQGILAFARVSSNSDETRGACKRCGRVGHLTFQCRNFLAVKRIGIELEDGIVQARIEAKVQAKIAEMKNRGYGADDEGSEEDDIDSDSSDSDTDPVQERIIAERQRAKSRRGSQSEEDGKKISRHRSSRSSKDKKKDRRKRHESSDQDSESDSDRMSRNDRKRRRTHRRKDDPSDNDGSGGERRRHRHHHKRRCHRKNAPNGGRVPI